MTDADFDAIIAAVSAATALRKSLEKHAVNPKTFYAAIDADEELGKRYARAKLAACKVWAEETLEIADEKPPLVETQFGEHTDAGYVAWQKNRIETRKWHLSKLLPKVYGDKTLIGSDPDNPIPPLVVIGGAPKPGSDGGTSNDQG